MKSEPNEGALSKLLADTHYRVMTLLGQCKPSGLSESPIEALMEIAIQANAMFNSIRFTAAFIARPDETGSVEFWRDMFADEPTMLLVQPQAQLEGWRVDFLIHVRSPSGWRILIVECDGHEFHERTKEQAARDRSRDREAQLRGIPVYRFTGSEIHNSAFECGAAVISAAETISLKG